MKQFLGMAASVVALAFAGNASAVVINVTDISFSTSGASEGFTWSATPSGPLSINLTSGSQIFTYGTFNTTDFPWDLSDRADNNDSLNVSFKLTPPGSSSGGEGQPDATKTGFLGLIGDDVLVIDFDNDWTNILFGDNGLYQLRFLDPLALLADGSTALRGELNLVRDSATTSVPEPGTIALLGVGLLGLGFARARSSARVKG